MPTAIVPGHSGFLGTVYIAVAKEFYAMVSKSPTPMDGFQIHVILQNTDQIQTLSTMEFKQEKMANRLIVVNNYKTDFMKKGDC